jgi:Kdo2-lipid IVA lauroyltransferase/acyltransferase
MNRLLSIVITSTFNLLALIPLKMLSPLARFMGWLLWVSGSESRKVTEENLRICFPEKTEPERIHIAKQRMWHLSMTVLELGAVWCWTPQKLLEYMDTPQNEALLDQLVAKGKGVVLLVPHHGNWEALGPYVGSKHPLVCLYQPPKIEAVGNIVLKSRSRFSSELAPTNAKGVKMLLKALKRGEVVSILPDQVPPAGSGDFAPFFGTPALTMTLVYNLLKRTGASVAISYAKRVNGQKHFQPIFREVSPALYSSDTQKSIEALNESVESVVSECPEQYQWEYKRFKRQPNGEKPYK